MPGNFLHELVGSMSQGAVGNPTVAMIEAAFAHHGLHWRYINMEVTPPDLAAAVQGARALGFRGFNCSMPHKVAVIAHLDGLGESAGIMGAVNCVVLREGKFIGENTDGKGFLKSLREVIDPRGKRIVLLGAGGAARAIAVELGLAGAQHLTIVNRHPERGQELAALIRAKLSVWADWVPWASDYAVPEDADVFINGTSVGLYDGEARVPVQIESLHAGQVIADVIFSPPRTRLIREAEERGCRTIDGLGMIVNQGVVSVEYWTGVSPDPVVMRRAVEAALGL